MTNDEIVKELLIIQQKIEHDNYTWENLKTLIDKITKTTDDKEVEQKLFMLVGETCRHFGILPKSGRKEDIEEFNEEVADLVMLNLINKISIIR